VRGIADDEDPGVLALGKSSQFERDISASDLGVPAAELGEHSLKVRRAAGHRDPDAARVAHCRPRELRRDRRAAGRPAGARPSACRAPPAPVS